MRAFPSLIASSLVVPSLLAAAGIAGCGATEPKSVFEGDGGGGPSDPLGPIDGAIDAPSSDPGPTFGDGGESSPDGAILALPASLTVAIRDFKLYDAGDPKTNPDFENIPKTDQNGSPSTNYYGPWDDPLIVEDTLGADGKPVYASTSGKTLTTHGATGFNQWYRDVDGVNIHVDYPLSLTEASPGVFQFDSQISGIALSNTDSTKMFFPIDDGTPYATKFGDQGDPHNYSFTVELHTKFTYQGSEYFNFRGDDDVFVFINNKRVINLGGIHGPETSQVSLDTVAAAIGIQKGNDYNLDFFSAERHKTGSNILFSTTIKLRPVVIR